jgi:multiple sugar transport system substrate-binding protein
MAKKSKKSFKLIPILLAFVLIISACSSSETNSDGNSSGDKIQLTMSTWGNPAEIKVIQRALDAFMEKEPNIEVKLIPIPNDGYRDKILTQLSGGKGSDVFYVGAEDISTIRDTGKVAELSDFLNSSESYVKPEAFSEGLWGAARTEDGIYGVTVDCNPYLMYYNKKVLEEAGIKSPQEYYDEGNWNWDTFAEVTGKIRDMGKRGFIAENGSSHLFNWIWTNGGKMYDDQGNIILEENQKAIEAFEFIEEMVAGGNFTYGGSLPKGQGADAMFMSNQVGFVAAGRWLTPMFSQNESLEFDYIPWPTNTGEKMEPTVVATAYMVANKNSKHLEEAMKFVSFYTSAEGQETRLADNGNAIPSIDEADNVVKNAKIPEHPMYLLDARNIGIVDDNQSIIPGLDKEIADILDLMYLEKNDAEKTMDAVVKKAESMIQEYKNQ